MKFFTTTIICLGHFMDKEGYLPFTGEKMCYAAVSVCAIRVYKCTTCILTYAQVLISNIFNF